MKSNKPKVIKDFNRLKTVLQEQIKLAYPYGFNDSLISFTKPDGTLVSVLPYETEDKYYLLKMSVHEAVEIVALDDDYDGEGNLKEGVKIEYEEKYIDLDQITEDEIDDNLLS